MASSNDSIMPLPAGKQFRSFPLYSDYGKTALLPDEHDLVINMQSGHFILVNWSVRYIIADGVFKPADELPFIYSLLSAWPSPVKNEQLLQDITNLSRDEAEDLIELGGDHTLEPIHRLVDSCRHLLRPLGIEIQNVNGTSYKLSRFVPRSNTHVSSTFQRRREP